MIFIGLDLLGVGFYAMSVFAKTVLRSAEGGLK